VCFRSSIGVVISLFRQSRSLIVALSVVDKLSRGNFLFAFSQCSATRFTRPTKKTASRSGEGCSYPRTGPFWQGLICVVFLRLIESKVRETQSKPRQQTKDGGIWVWRRVNTMTCQGRCRRLHWHPSLVPANRESLGQQENWRRGKGGRNGWLGCDNWREAEGSKDPLMSR